MPPEGDALNQSRSTLSRLGRLAVPCLLAVGIGFPAQAQNPADSKPPAAQTTSESTPRGASMSEQHQIKGTFDVNLTPQAPDEGHEASGIGRLLLDKTFQGELEATSQGQMLAFRSPVEGSAGYVAMETVTGSLGGRRGSFVLQHSGTMSAGSQHLDLHVVPDSGSEELQGLAGSMSIIIEEGQHFYEMEYTLPVAQ